MIAKETVIFAYKNSRQHSLLFSRLPELRVNYSVWLGTALTFRKTMLNCKQKVKTFEIYIVLETTDIKTICSDNECPSATRLDTSSSSEESDLDTDQL